MKIQKKEENVFSTSALDLFCSAMGVFMLLCFIVLPYYMNEDSKKEAKETEVSVVNPGLTIALSWEVTWKDTKPGKNGKLETHSDNACCDFDLIVTETLPGIDTPFLHDFKTREKAYQETKALLVADGVRGGSETWVQPAVKAGESCEVYATYYWYNGSNSDNDLKEIKKIIAEKRADSYSFILHVLVLSGTGETQKWKLELPQKTAEAIMLSDTTTPTERKQVLDNGYRFDALPFLMQKRLSLLKISVGNDCSMKVEVPDEILQGHPELRLQQDSK